MELFEAPDFRTSLRALDKRGGKFQKAAAEVRAFMDSVREAIRTGDFSILNGARLTKNGESRIRHCQKYDLVGYARLITIQHAGAFIVCYCGDHDDCDRWLTTNRGLTYATDKDRRLVKTYDSRDVDEGTLVGTAAGISTRPLYEMLPEDIFDRLVETLPKRYLKTVLNLESTVLDSELWELASAFPDADAGTAFRDVFALLRSDKPREALVRLKGHFGETTPIEEIPVFEWPAIVDSDVLRRIDPTSPLYQEGLKRFLEAATYKDWMLFLHPTQQVIVDEDFPGPSKLVGVSGSGKTCVVVQRAVRLAEKYEGERILIITLNRALANMINELVDACCPSSHREQIDVLPLFDVCLNQIERFVPSARKRFSETTWKHNEHVDEIWQEYYRCETNNFDARVFQTIHDSLLSSGFNPERYLRDEIDWIRSALSRHDRSTYFEIERVGRKVAFSRPFRELIVDGCEGWEEKMRVVGVTDALGLAQALHEQLAFVRPEYRCVLVDEVQDFGNIELQIVRRLVADAENDLFLCGDAAQAVTTKYQRLRSIGIEVPAHRSRRLSLNYRNSSDVLNAAWAVFYAHVDDGFDSEDLEILHPERSAFSGATPLLLYADSLETEIAAALQFADDFIVSRPSARACIAICGYSLPEVSRFGEGIGYKVLDGRDSISDGQIVLSDLGQTKGFEFDLMCILNCSDGVLPDSTAPKDEQHRDLATLYVAMTRAKTDLVLSWSSAPSGFLAGSEDQFLTASWNEYVPLIGERFFVPKPAKVDSYRTERTQKPLSRMSGEEFLYSEFAIGVSAELSAKLRLLVDGRGLKRGNRPVKWATVGDAISGIRRDATLRNLWGPEVSRQLLELGRRLDL